MVKSDYYSPLSQPHESLKSPHSPCTTIQRPLRSYTTTRWGLIGPAPRRHRVPPGRSALRPPRNSRAHGCRVEIPVPQFVQRLPQGPKITYSAHARGLCSWIRSLTAHTHAGSARGRALGGRALERPRGGRRKALVVVVEEARLPVAVRKARERRWRAVGGGGRLARRRWKAEGV